MKALDNTFNNYVAACKAVGKVNKFYMLTKCSSYTAYEHNDECQTYDDADSILDSLFMKVPKEEFARHLRYAWITISTQFHRKSTWMDSFATHLSAVFRLTRCTNACLRSQSFQLMMLSKRPAPLTRRKRILKHTPSLECVVLQMLSRLP